MDSDFDITSPPAPLHPDSYRDGKGWVYFNLNILLNTLITFCVLTSVVN